MVSRDASASQSATLWPRVASIRMSKLFNADRLTLYAVNDDKTSIVSKIKMGLNSSGDLMPRAINTPAAAAAGMSARCANPS